MYHITLNKDFGANPTMIKGEHEFNIYTSPNMEFCINAARKMNETCLINIQIEVFRVWESQKGKYNKKTSKLIYPTIENPLFY